MDWGKLIGTVIEAGAPLLAKIAEAAFTSNAMTAEQEAQLDADLAEMVVQLRKDAFVRVREQAERNAAAAAALEEKFPDAPVLGSEVIEPAGAE